MLEPQQNTHICACRSLLSPCDALQGQEQGQECLWPRSDAVWQCRAAAQCALCNELLNKSLSLDRVCHQTKYPEGISVTFQRQGAARASAKGCAFSGWQIEWEKKDVWVEARGGQKREQRHTGSPEEQSRTESYGPVLKRDYFNLHNKKCGCRLNSTQST